MSTAQNIMEEKPNASEDMNVDSDFIPIMLINILIRYSLVMFYCV